MRTGVGNLNDFLDLAEYDGVASELVRIIVARLRQSNQGVAIVRHTEHERFDMDKIISAVFAAVPGTKYASIEANGDTWVVFHRGCYTFSAEPVAGAKPAPVLKTVVLPLKIGGKLYRLIETG